ncbi:MAG: MFS transporter [Terrimesophilobacter sp.]
MARFQRRNFLFLVLDGATFAFAISLLSETTIIPAFIQQLSGSSLLVGLVAATFAVGRYLPQLVGAHLVRGRSTRKPLLLGIVIAERVGILAIAVTAQFIGVLSTAVVLVLFFVTFCAYAVTTGLIGPVYGDFVAKALTSGRGWFYGIVQLVGGLLGFSAAIVAEGIIRTHDFPQGNQICFWICFALSFLSILFIVGLKEIPYPHIEARPRFWTTLREIPGLIGGDPAYARFILARMFLALSTLGIGFVVVDGIARGLRVSDAALLAAVFILSQALLGFLLGLVGNYLGWRLVVILGGVFIAGGMLLAVYAQSLTAYIAIFVLLGGANAVTVIGDPNLSIELAPSARTSMYLGTTSTVLAPFFIVGPLIAGALVGTTGYPPIFFAAAGIAMVGLLLALRVHEPRKHTTPDAVGQPGATP